MAKFKGIILAGGTGSRLYPMTFCVNKQLLPIYDKPMIYYPLSTIMSANIDEILIITRSKELELYTELFGDGSKLGLNIEYAIQESPDGLAQSFIIAEKFLNNAPSALILGDNLFFSSDLHIKMQNIKADGATIFAYRVDDPSRYGVIDFDKDKKAISIEEKPLHPKSNYAVTGLYFYDNNASHYAKQLKPSARGELEITDLNMVYLNEKKLNVEILSKGTAWLDTGTPESLLDASDFVRIMEQRQGIKLGCIEEIAYNKGLINKEQLLKLAQKLNKTAYGKYLIELVNRSDINEYYSNSN